MRFPFPFLPVSRQQTVSSTCNRLFSVNKENATMAKEAVYNYMKTQNKPCSVNDIIANLHNEYAKSAVQHAVDKLVTDKKLFKKVYGTQKIYCVVQDAKYDNDEIVRIATDLETHAKEVENKYEEVKKEVREHETLLSSLKSSMSLEDTQKEHTTLQQSIKELTCKLDKLMETNSTEDLPESKRKAQETLEEYTREYIKRKKMCSEIIDCILENYDGSKEELYEEVGIDSTTM